MSFSISDATYKTITPAIEGDKVITDILTGLPVNLPLSTGDWMEILEEEKVYFIPIEGYLKDMTVN